MSLKQTLCVYDLIDCASVKGEDIVALFQDFPHIEVMSKTVKDHKGQSDFVRILIPGTQGKSQHKDAPTLGIIGRLGGIGARPSRIGVVSDADGAIAALAAALKLAQMHERVTSYSVMSWSRPIFAQMRQHVRIHLLILWTRPLKMPR